MIRPHKKRRRGKGCSCGGNSPTDGSRRSMVQYTRATTNQTTDASWKQLNGNHCAINSLCTPSALGCSFERKTRLPSTKKELYSITKDQGLIESKRVRDQVPIRQVVIEGDRAVESARITKEFDGMGRESSRVWCVQCGAGRYLGTISNW